MHPIQVEANPSPDRLEKLGVARWPIWEKEVSEFPWSYDSDETCYILEGKVMVTPKDGAPVEIAKGDLVTFPTGLNCIWKVLEPIRKHYRFG